MLMVNQDNFLDLWDIFANELVGDAMLFIILALVLVWFVSIKAKMPFQLSILFGLLLLTIFFAQESGFLIIWVFVVLIVGVMFYYVLNKAIR